MGKNNECKDKIEDTKSPIIPSSDEYLTRPQVCERLGIAKLTALHGLNNGKIKNAFLYRQQWYVHINEIIRIEQERLSRIDYYTTSQIVKRFNCHLRTVMKLIGLNTFPNAVLINKIWLVPEKDLIKYENDCQPPDGFITAASFLVFTDSYPLKKHVQGKGFCVCIIFEGFTQCPT